MNTTKHYVHKTLGWIAKEKTNGDYRIYKQTDGGLEKDIMDYVHCNLFVDSQDREEVVEKDWIDHCVFDIHKRCENSKYRKTPRHIIRREIEKHCPQVKKFTRQDIYAWRRSIKESVIGCWSYEDTVEFFLKEKGLLEE